MKKRKSLVIVNTLLMVFILFQFISGIMLELKVESVITELHGLTGLILVILVIIHVILNWNWVKTTYFKNKQKTREG